MYKRQLTNTHAHTKKNSLANIIPCENTENPIMSVVSTAYVDSLSSPGRDLPYRCE